LPAAGKARGGSLLLLLLLLLLLGALINHSRADWNPRRDMIRTDFDVVTGHN